MKIFTREQSFNNFLLFALLAICINMLAGYTVGYATRFSTTVFIIGIVLLVSFIIIHTKGYQFTAKILSTIFFNVFFFTFSYYYGLRSLVFIYYFPFIVSFIYMFNGSATRAQAKIFIYTCFVFIGAIFIVCNMNGVKALTEVQIATMYRKNFLVAFVLSAYYFYGIFGFLIKQKELAEEASQSKARFLSIMSHELRTPLNGIISAINLMDEAAEEEERQRFSKVLQSSSQHLLHLVNNVLDYSKASSGKMELNPVACSVEQVIHNLKAVFEARYKEKNLALNVSVDASLQQTVLLDDVRFVQVLTNLLSNALKFTEAGKVELRAACLAATNHDIEMEISVSDTGQGLSSAQQAKIFESFNSISNKSRKLESTGLGLSICKMIVEMMGSSLCIESKEGKGSRFYFRISLPLAGKEIDTTTGVASAASSLEGVKVLIAEDNLINMMVAREFLKRWKMNILEAKNGLAAQQLLIQHSDIELLLLDLQMPEMNGYELMEWIGKTRLRLPVIAFTAEIMANEEKRDLFERGFTGLVPKPFAPEELEQKMKTALQQKSAALLV